MVLLRFTHIYTKVRQTAMSMESVTLDPANAMQDGWFVSRFIPYLFGHVFAGWKL